VPAYPRFWKDWVEWGGTVIPQRFLSLLFFRRDCCKQTLLTLCHTRGLVWCPSILWDRVPADPRLGMAGGEFSTDLGHSTLVGPEAGGTVVTVTCVFACRPIASSLWGAGRVGGKGGITLDLL
jgi:hypothetical protein